MRRRSAKLGVFDFPPEEDRPGGHTMVEKVWKIRNLYQREKGG